MGGGSKGGFATFLAFDRIAIGDVAVIDVESFDLNARQRRHGLIQCERIRTSRNTGAIHSAIDVDEKRNLDFRRDRSGGDFFSGSTVVDERGKLCLRKLFRELNETGELRTHRLIREQDIR